MPLTEEEKLRKIIAALTEEIRIMKASQPKTGCQKSENFVPPTSCEMRPRFACGKGNGVCGSSVYFSGRLVCFFSNPWWFAGDIDGCYLSP